MSDITLVLLAAGNSSRFASSVKKQWLRSGDRPIWLHVAEHFSKAYTFDDIIIVSSATELNYMKHFASYTYIEGGESRQASLKNALGRVKTSHVLVSDVARCCVPASMIETIITQKDTASCVVPTLTVTDTLYLNQSPIDREKTRIIQTPQLSRTAVLAKALQSETLFTDDSSAIASLGEQVHFVQGSPLAHKLTTLEDLQKMVCLETPSSQTLTGFGIDTHPFVADKKMFLCGVEIDADYGFKAHSDGDVAIHALIDALLGAAGMGDIGELYPDTDSTYAGADSKILLRDTVKHLESFGFCIGNIDLTIVAETPKINPHKAPMREILSEILKIRPNFVNIKATTSEKLGFVGRKEGVTVHAVANLTYLNWKKL